MREPSEKDIYTGTVKAEQIVRKFATGGVVDPDAVKTMCDTHEPCFTLEALERAHKNIQDKVVNGFTVPKPPMVTSQAERQADALERIADTLERIERLYAHGT